MRNVYVLVGVILTIGVLFFVSANIGEKKKEKKDDGYLTLLINNATFYSNPKPLKSGTVKDEKILEAILDVVVSEQESHLCEIGGLYKYSQKEDGSPKDWFCTSKDMLENVVIS